MARVARAAAFDDVFAQALRVATTGRPGPVALEIPEDVFTEPPRDEAPLISRQDAAFPRFRPALARRDVERVAALFGPGSAVTADAILTASARSTGGTVKLP